MGECGGCVGVIKRCMEDGRRRIRDCGGTEEREIEHEVSDCEVCGVPGEVEGEAYVVRLLRCQGCGEVGCTVGIAIPISHSISNGHPAASPTQETTAWRCRWR